MLKEFNLVSTPNGDVLIRYFWNGLRPSIRSQNNECGQDLDTWQETIKKAINLKVKTARLPQSLVRDMDNQYLWENWPAKIKNSTKESKVSDKNKTYNSSANLASGGQSGQPLNHFQDNSSSHSRGGSKGRGRLY